MSLAGFIFCLSAGGCIGIFLCVRSVLILTVFSGFALSFCNASSVPYRGTFVCLLAYAVGHEDVGCCFHVDRKGFF